MKLPRTELPPVSLTAPLLAALALLAIVVPGPGARALTTDREQPIQIEADSAEADDAKKITIYKGDVVIDQGTLRITGDHVTIHYNERGDFTKLIALGNPARFRQLPDGEADEEKNYQRARASRMEYFKENDTIVLLGNAVYGQGGDRVAADRIDYDSRNSRMKARTMTASKDGKKSGDEPAKKSRVRITIQPKKKSAN